MIDCERSGKVKETSASDGTRLIRVCQPRPVGPAVSSLRSARAQIAREGAMSAEAREQVLEKLDREIERLEKSE